MESLLSLLKRYKTSILPPYSPKDYLNLAVTLFLLVSLPAALILVHQRQELEPKAKEGGVETYQTPSIPEFLSNELLVKVKKASRGKVHDGDTTDTGIAALNSLNLQTDPNAKFDYKIKGFEKVAKAGKDSKTDEDLFSWYKLTLDAPTTLIEGKLNHAKLIIQENPADFDNKPHANSGQAAANLQQVIDKLTQDPDVETVELNYQVNILAVPNDPYYSSTGSWGQAYPDLWGIKKISPELAWDQTTGVTSVVVAGIDTGVDRNHEDIKDNMWVNGNEIPGNGIDDDANGYKDDYYGWDWVNNDNDPMDDHGHGTHTVGTIAAVGNNAIGVVGVNWTSRIMALKFLNSSGSGYLDNGIKALQYAADMGARVSSNSWACACNSTAIDDAVKYEHDKGMVMVAAAGNSNTDAIGFSPASADYAVTVAASDANDVKASFSNWGEKIDVAAPGVDILSIRASNNPMCTAARTVGTNYCYVSGTSMATPHVAGLAALLLAKNPALTNEEVRQIIRTGATDLGAAGKDRDYGYGRINATSSMNLATTHPLTPVITSPRSRTVIFGTSSQIRGSIPGPNFASYKIEMGTGRSPTSWTTLVTSTTQVTTDSTLAIIDTTKFTEGNYILRLTATDIDDKNYQFQVFDVEIDNFDVLISFPLDLVSLGSIDVWGTAQTKNGIPFANYILEWGAGSSPTSWSQTGISLVNGGAQPVVNGKLATWDTTSLADGQSYTLRLTVTSTIGVSYQSQARVTADKDLVKGWPKQFINTICYCEATPTLADVDGDGSKEIIIGAPDGKIYIFRKDGSDFPNFPLLLTSTSYFDQGVTVDDLDNDGKKEIVATDGNGITYIVRSNGTLYPGWSQAQFNTYHNSPTISDLDGDRKKDIVIMDVKTWVDRTDVKLHAFKLNGTELTGFPKTYTLPPVGFDAGQLYPTSYMGALSIADLDKDEKPEIAWGFSNRMYLFDNTGNIVRGWPFITPNFNGKTMLFYSAASSGDVDGDGNLELFAGTAGQGCLACDTQLFGWKKDGTVLPGWPKTNQSDGISVPWYNMATPSFSDVDNDGKDEIIVGYTKFAIFDVEGKKVLTNNPSIASQPAIIDIDGNERFEFAGTYYGSLMIVRDDGTTYWQKSIGNSYTHAPVTLSDLDNNGKLEVVFVKRPLSATNGALNLTAYLWEVSGANSAKYEWPMFSYDAARSGRLVLGPQPTPPPTTPTPTPTATLTPTPPGADTIPPTVSLTNPVSGGTVARNSTVAITASASDNVGVTKVGFLINGSLKCTDTTSPYSCSWKVTGKPNASYTITAKAYDAAGNSSAASITVVSQ